MSQRNLFFYGKDKDNKGRSLPDDRGGEVLAPTVAAEGNLRYDEPRTAEQLAEDIMEELCSPHARQIAMNTSAPLSAIFGMLADFASSYDTITVVPTEGTLSSSVRVCVHNLYFALGTLIHHAVLHGVGLTLRAVEDEDASEILLECDVATGSEAEACALFGLDCGERLAILGKIADASRFSFSLRTGERTVAAFRLLRGTADTLRVLAVSDPTLYAAFMLPLVRFCIS